jgi:hypothetical protein
LVTSHALKTERINKYLKKKKKKTTSFWLLFYTCFSVTNQLVKSEIRFRQSGKLVGLNRKEFWSIGARILVKEKEI